MGKTIQPGASAAAPWVVNTNLELHRRRSGFNRGRALESGGFHLILADSYRHLLKEKEILL